MKKILFLSIVFSLLLISCGEEKKQDDVKNEAEEITKLEIVEVIEDTSIEEKEEAEIQEEIKEEIQITVEAVQINADVIRSHLVDPIRDSIENVMDGNLIFNQMPLMYVLGFSADGKIAWCESRVFEGKGTTKFSFYVQDLVTDKVIESIEYEPEELNNDIIDDFMKENQLKVQNCFNKYKIALMYTDIQDFPALIDKNNYDTDIIINNSEEKLYDIINVCDYECYVKKNDEGKKLITSKTNYQMENAIVSGYIISPFEERIAVIIAEAKYGFEGFDLYFNICGCDLTKNFK